MTRQRFIVLLILIFVFAGCGETDQDLIGKWYHPNYDNLNRANWSIIEFSQDHTYKATDLFLDSLPGTWKINSDSLILKFKNETNEEFHFSYHVEKNNLHLSSYNSEAQDTIEHHYIRASDKFGYYERKMGFTIHPPQSNDSLVDLRNNWTSFYVFCYKPSNDELHVRTTLSENLTDIRNEFDSHAKSQRPEIFYNMKLVFIADKEVTDDELRMISDSINGINNYKAFRIFETDSVNFRNFDFLGKQI